jgi:4-phytase / acid phosphatase
MNGPLRLASTFTENFPLEYASGMSGSRLGWGRLDAAKLQQIMALHTAYADLMRRTPYLAQVWGSNLLSHVLPSLDQAASAKPVKGAMGPPKTALVVISGHDTNISNLSGMLRLSWVLPSHQPDDAPPGGALIFSLWKSASTGRYAVRLQFVAQTLNQMHEATPLSVTHPPPIANLFVPGCSTSAEGYACDWTRFVQAAREAIDSHFTIP